MTTVLVVDDDPSIRLVLRVELTAEGYDVVEAADGAEALARIDEWSPSVVLLDLMMPGVDGWEVLRALEGKEEPPVIVISALATEEGLHVAQALGLGAIDYVAKPFEPGHLVSLIDAILRVDQAERDEYRRIRLSRASGA